MSHLRAMLKLGKALLFAVKMLNKGRREGYGTIAQPLLLGFRDKLGIRVKFNDAAQRAPKPAIYAANHMSYLDVILLGGLLEASFVSKKEVRKWPVVGRVAESVGTIFIDRTPAALRQSHGQVASALNEGYNVVLFPESTTTRGDNVQPFKRGLLSVVFNNLSGIPLKKDIHVHPVSLHVTHIDGKPVDSEPELRQKYTWVGGENILIHAWNLARLKSVDVEITVHNAVNPANFSNARHYTEAVHQAVASCLPPFKTSGSAHPQAGP